MIVLALNQGLMQVPAAGGELTPLFTPDGEQASSYPQILPDSNTVLFTIGHPRDASELHLVVPSTGEHRTLLTDAANAPV